MAYNTRIDEKPPSTNIYVNKEDFMIALTKYKALCDEKFPEVPQVPEYIGSCIMLIAKNLARRPNFSGYSWRDEMIGDAIETCLKYVKSFDPSRGTSPFAYFSQVCWYSFIGRINAEKKQSKIKREIVRYANFESFATQNHDDEEFNFQIQEFLSGIGDDEIEIPIKKKKVESQSGLDGFFE